ncbi:N-acetylneuraminate epimerase precursor [compost metagenome]
MVEQLALGPSARAASQMAAVNGSIYLYGGTPASLALKDFWKYDPVTDQWTQLPDGPNIRERGTLVEVDGLLYLVGGKSSTEGVAGPVQCYDPIAGTWSARAAYSQVRYDATAVAIGSLIYLHGGFASSDNNMLWVYDTVANTWGILAFNLGTGNNRSEHWAGVVDGKMYIGGGNSQTNNDIYMYDPQNNSWNKRRAHTPRQLSAAMASYNGKVYVHGNSSYTADLWCYTP